MPSVQCPGCARVIDMGGDEMHLTVECAQCDTRFPAADYIATADEEPASLDVRHERWSHGLSGFRCPFCGTDSPPVVQKKVSTAGWIIFIVLLIGCFPLCLIGLFVTEDFRVCGSCGIKLD